MADSNSEQKFNAAVRVIRSLPKSGSFKPSHEMMLKFYGNYKQAMEGPCKEAKPSFWDVVKKAKWEAWSKLGNISKKDAMDNYVNGLKEVIEEMPETEQASQFVESLEPFYKAVYYDEANPPPVFNMFRSKHGNGLTHKMNGHIEMNGNNEDENRTSEAAGKPNGVILNTSRASFLHNIENIDYPERNGSHGVEVVDLSNHEEVNDKISDNRKEDGQDDDGPELMDNNEDIHSKYDARTADKDDDDDDDDDDLFCDSLGPELLEQVIELDKTELSNTDDVIASEENLTNCYHRNYQSSLSDVEIIEQFSTRNDLESSIPEIDRTTHVHFDDLSSSSGDQSTSKTVDNLSKTIPEKTDIIQPNQLGCGSGGGDEKELLRASTSQTKQVQRNVAHQSDKHSRYGHRYRRRSQESDSDDSPSRRSDHNSSSERDDIVIDKIADLLIDIQDNMKKILERLRRVENSLQRNQNLSFENYMPSKTVIFLIVWPFVVNIIFRFLQRRYENSSKR